MLICIDIIDIIDIYIYMCVHACTHAKNFRAWGLIQCLQMGVGDAQSDKTEPDKKQSLGLTGLNQFRPVKHSKRQHKQKHNLSSRTRKGGRNYKLISWAFVQQWATGMSTVRTIRIIIMIRNDNDNNNGKN